MAERPLGSGCAPGQAALTPGELCTTELPMVTSGQTGLLLPHSTDQEMQWLPEAGRSPTQLKLPAQSQCFLEPCEMGSEGPRVLYKGPPEELCEAMCEDPPQEPCDMPCVELCERTPPWELGRDPLTEPCEGLCEKMSKDPPPQKPGEDPPGVPGQGKARLPSIVVEATEMGEVESGELRWPPDDFLLLEREDELFTDEDEQAAGPRPGPPPLESTLNEVLL
ncbi:uncharacterized protein LOC142019081 [Carettochelys insculpta]|uniref:uncharacterized protein LOC142019081 n=1 Tax=Carettochelys insculpta TaxID=44489 RepID=UPI003EB70D09